MMNRRKPNAAHHGIGFMFSPSPCIHGITRHARLPCCRDMTRRYGQELHYGDDPTCPCVGWVILCVDLSGNLFLGAIWDTKCQRLPRSALRHDGRKLRAFSFLPRTEHSEWPCQAMSVSGLSLNGFQVFIG
jgi:hypothetical protein